MMQFEPETHSQKESGPSNEANGAAPAAVSHVLRVEKRPKRFRFLRSVGIVVLGMVLFGISAWASGALFFDVHIPYLNILLFWGYLLTLSVIWFKIKRRLLALGLTLACFGAVLTWWLLIPPSNNRNWQPDVAVLPFADIQGKRVTLHNIRYCKYRSETDYKVEHYDKTFDLNKLRGVDLYLVYWGSPLIAHTMASFEFGDDDNVCISIETR